MVSRRIFIIAVCICISLIPIKQIFAVDPDNIPFGINVDPVWGMSNHENYDWEDVFTNINTIRNGNPIMLRITLRAHWINKCPQPPVLCPSPRNPFCHFEDPFFKDPDSFLSNVHQIVYWAEYYDLPVLGILHGTPPWNDLNSGTTCANRGSGSEPPNDVFWWTDFVAGMVTLFPYISQWEIWNEPDGDGNPGVGTEPFYGTATEFAELIYVPAYKKIKSISDDKVTGPGLAYVNPNGGWDYGGDNCDWINYATQHIKGAPNPPFDAFSFHHYEVDEGVPENYVCNMKDKIEDVRTDVVACGVPSNFHLYLTEYGQIENSSSCGSDANNCRQCGDIEYFIWHQIYDNHGYPPPCNGDLHVDCDKYFIFTLYDGLGLCRWGLYVSPYNPRCYRRMHSCKINQYYNPGTTCPNYCDEPLCDCQ